MSSVAGHLAAAGRLDLIDLPVETTSVDDMSSAEEAAWWRDALKPAVARVATAVAGRSVLLVVDATASGWPVTVAAAHLRRAGASHVLPFVVHRRV